MYWLLAALVVAAAAAAAFRFRIGPRPMVVTHAEPLDISDAQARYDAGDYEEATTLLEGVLDVDENHKEALYLLGMSHMQLERFEAALGPFRHLAHIRAGFRDYAGWLLVARCEEQLGRPADAVKTLEALVERAPRLKHLVLLAEAALAAGDEDKARIVISHARRKKGDEQWVSRRDRLAAKI